MSGFRHLAILASLCYSFILVGAADAAPVKRHWPLTTTAAASFVQNGEQANAPAKADVPPDTKKSADQAKSAEGEEHGGWKRNLFLTGLALFLVAINGFFVAAEFAFVKVRGSQIQQFVREGRPFAKTARWLAERLEDSLSACQLGITIASLALGAVGEPAFHALISPFLSPFIESETVMRIFSYAFALTVITALHLVIGEQAPKIFAIRKPEKMALWCAVPLKIFFICAYPLLKSLNWCTEIILKWLGVDSAGHDTPHTEEEIRGLLREAHIHGDLTRSEHHLINAVFEFDDMVCRRVMVARADISYFTTDQPWADCLEQAKRTRHTRFPLCEGSLDHVIGVIHIKDLTGLPPDADVDLKQIARPPKQVPDEMPISRLLRHFQGTHQHMAFVIDEYGTVIGIVTMENVIEQIVGKVEDEFDLETPDVVPDGAGQYIIQGSAPIEVIRRALKLELLGDVDTFSGLLVSVEGEILEAGDKIDLDGATAEVLEVKGSRAVRVRVRLDSAPYQTPEAANAADSGKSTT
jgi:CBS domain containing-hemolysin-like protein